MSSKKNMALTGLMSTSDRSTKRIIMDCKGQHLIECCMGNPIPGQTIADLKKDLLDEINTNFGKRYGITDLNSWIAGRRVLPNYIRRFLKTYLLQYLVEDEEEAEVLDNIQLVIFKAYFGEKEGEILNDILTN